MAALDRHFELHVTQRDTCAAGKRLWLWRRETAWRFIKHTMKQAGIVGHRACPRGLRHAFGIGTLHAGVPIDLVQGWLGHARVSTTAI
jgi:site-specific recombinase XerD